MVLPGVAQWVVRIPWVISLPQPGASTSAGKRPHGCGRHSGSHSTATAESAQLQLRRQFLAVVDHTVGAQDGRQPGLPAEWRKPSSRLPSTGMPELATVSMLLLTVSVALSVFLSSCRWPTSPFGAETAPVKAHLATRLDVEHLLIDGRRRPGRQGFAAFLFSPADRLAARFMMPLSIPFNQ